MICPVVVVVAMLFPAWSLRAVALLGAISIVSTPVGSPVILNVIRIVVSPPVISFPFVSVISEILAAVAFAESTNVSYVIDTTQTPTLTTPAASSSDNLNLNVDYTLPETASNATVKLIFTRTAGTADAGSPHTLTMVSETSQSITLDASNFSGNASVESVTGGNNLVNGSIYTVRIEYQDTSLNPVAFAENTNFTYNDVSQTPTLTSPASASIDNTDITIGYILPETAADTTVKMTFTRTQGSEDSESPHVLTMVSESSQNLSLDASNFSGNSQVESVSGGNSLVDGAIYTVRLEYQNAALSGVAYAENTSFTYDTTSPTFSSSTLGAANAYVDLVLSEGIYNASQSGASADDFNIIFTQNTGGATAASITEITDTSGNPATGGETTIRIALTITGEPTGIETIEIAPSSATALSDQAGNNVATTISTGQIILTKHVYTALDRAVAAPSVFNAAKASTITFMNLPQDTSIRIYTVTGRKVYDATFQAGDFTWGVTDSTGRALGSNVYFVVFTSNGSIKKQRIVVER
jgi:hypothetical protein